MVRLGASGRVPFAVQEAIVHASGTAFWFKRPLISLFQRAGVPRPLIDEYSSMSKFTFAREILRELDAREDAGIRVQHQIVRDLASLRTFGDDVDAAAARRAVDALRAAAEEHGILRSAGANRRAELEQLKRQQEQAACAQHRDAEGARAAELGRLYAEFKRYLAETGDLQTRGYALEKLVGGLIVLNRLPYQAPFRKGTVTQTDGCFTFEGFQYLLEIRWRRNPATADELAAFSAKVSRSLQSTRGLFLSVAGFRTEVVEEVARDRRNILLMSGQELALILEGRLTLCDALTQKIDEGARRGNLFHDLAAPQ